MFQIFAFCLSFYLRMKFASSRDFPDFEFINFVKLLDKNFVENVSNAFLSFMLSANAICKFTRFS